MSNFKNSGTIRFSSSSSTSRGCATKTLKKGRTLMKENSLFFKLLQTTLLLLPHSHHTPHTALPSTNKFGPDNCSNHRDLKSQRRGNHYQKLICYNCNGIGHKANACPERRFRNANNDQRVTCYICHRVGHYATSCPERRPQILRNFPRNPRNNTSQQK